jgi:ABC-type glycerol-3-phosphate transport system substrate-binding protein
LGLPSKDGKGPSISINCSAAVSANSKEKTACIEFIKTLLSDEVQSDFVYRDGVVPVKKSAYETNSKEAVDKYNALYDRLSEIYTPTELIEYGFPWHAVDESAVDDFETMLESCKTLSSSDPGITMILNEEMPAYFTGQKSLDEVITIINNRANTYLSERG